MYSYVRARAEKRAENISSTFAASRTETSGGKTLFSAIASRSTGKARSLENDMTCPVAWTPASVRPAPVIFTGSWKMAEIARSSSPAIVRVDG